MGPPLTENRVRGVRTRAAHGEAEREEVADPCRHDVVAGLLGGGHHDDPGGPSPRHEIAKKLRESFASFPLAPTKVERELVDHEYVEPLTVRRRDLPPARRHQGDVTVIHDVTEALEGLDRLFRVRSHELIRYERPGRELDLLAVEEREVDRGVKGSGSDDRRERDGFARPRFPTDQQVVLRQPDLHRKTVLAESEEERLPE